MRKYSTLLVTVCMLCFLGGCGQKIDATVSTIIIEKNGAVTGIIIEDFSQPNYDLNQMQEMIQATIADYNEKVGSESVKINDLSVEKNIAKLSMHYKSAEDYEGFNKETLFVGTIEEALEAGYDMDVTLIEPGNIENAISKAELLKMQKDTIVISEEPIRIRTYGKIKYCNPDADVSEKRELATHNITGLSYIIL